MASYSTVGINDPAKSVPFYDALLGSIGMKTVYDMGERGRIYAGGDKQFFGVLKPHDGKPATVGNGTMIGFPFNTLEEITAFHAKALELGATCEGAPGLRGPEGSGVYFAYVRDLEGNKLCAFRFGE
jgi:catechol 2,3-dioxygenase-like lactoylglutathione lyase family enzyme